jgi:DNA-binding NarL/FixJ family response regulator
MPDGRCTKGSSHREESSRCACRGIGKLSNFGTALDVSIGSIKIKIKLGDLSSDRLKGVRGGAEKKVIVAEKQKIVRDGLISLLSGIEGIETVGEAEDGLKALQLVEQLRPDLVLMDLSISETSGLSATKEIKNRFPETKILVLTTHDSEDYIRAAFQAGADGYCLKDSGLQELVSAVEYVLAGKIYFSPAISDKILHGYLQPHRPPKLDLLTRREKEILKFLGGGHTNEEIASLLSISDKTVSKHRSNIMRKLHCHTAADLAAFAIQGEFRVEKGKLG